MKKVNKSEVFKLAHKLYNESLRRFNVQECYRSALWSKSLKMAYKLIKESHSITKKTFNFIKLSVLVIIKDVLSLPNDLVNIVNPRQTVFI